jgi:peptidylprolyl isomerase
MLEVFVSFLLQVIKGWDQGIVGGEGIPPMLAGASTLNPAATYL